jgi:hypothetical protein
MRPKKGRGISAVKLKRGSLNVNYITFYS